MNLVRLGGSLLSVLSYSKRGQWLMIFLYDYVGTCVGVISAQNAGSQFVSLLPFAPTLLESTTEMGRLPPCILSPQHSASFTK